MEKKSPTLLAATRCCYLPKAMSGTCSFVLQKWVLWLSRQRSHSPITSILWNDTEDSKWTGSTWSYDVVEDDGILCLGSPTIIICNTASGWGTTFWETHTHSLSIPSFTSTSVALPQDIAATDYRRLFFREPLCPRASPLCMYSYVCLVTPWDWVFKVSNRSSTSYCLSLVKLLVLTTPLSLSDSCPTAAMTSLMKRVTVKTRNQLLTELKYVLTNDVFNRVEGSWIHTCISASLSLWVPHSMEDSYQWTSLPLLKATLFRASSI